MQKGIDMIEKSAVTKTKLITFTEDEIKKIEKKLSDKKGRIEVFGKILKNDKILTAFSRPNVYKKKYGKSKHIEDFVNLEDLRYQDQNGVSVENLKHLLSVSSDLTIPEVVELHDHTYLVQEGHHRITLQILAGRKKIFCNIEKGYLSNIKESFYRILLQHLKENEKYDRN